MPRHSVRNNSASTGLAAKLDRRWRSRPCDLVKDFGEKRAVDGVSLAVPAGSIFGLLGPNGAGKTTTLRMLLGIIEPSSGERRVLGHDRPIDAAHQIGYLPEERGLYPGMNAREAIAFMGALRGLPLSSAGAAPTNCSSSTASANGPESRSAPCQKAWRRPSSCSARSSTTRG